MALKAWSTPHILHRESEGRRRRARRAPSAWHGARGTGGAPGLGTARAAPHALPPPRDTPLQSERFTTEPLPREVPR